MLVDREIEGVIAGGHRRGVLVSWKAEVAVNVFRRQRDAQTVG